MAQNSIDSVSSRNATRIDIVLAGQRVGRIQTFTKDQSNNVQVLGELGRDYMVEMKKGVTAYTFSIARFLTRQDAFEPIKNGAPFSLEVRDSNGVDDGGNGVAETLEYFAHCMIQSLSQSISSGQAMIGVNATVVAIGKGLSAPRTAG